MTLYLEDLQIVELAIVRVKEPITNFAVKNAVVEVREHLSRLGDFNGNGVVDDNDLYRIKLAYGSYPGHPKWREEFDLNKDGIIDTADIATVAHHYGMRQCDVEPVDTILTDEAGLVNFGELLGKYYVTVSKEGYKTTSKTVEFPATVDIGLWPMKVIYASAGVVALAGIGILAGTKAARYW